MNSAEIQQEAINIIRSAKKIYNGESESTAIKIDRIRKSNPKAVSLTATLDDTRQVIIEEIDYKVLKVLGYEQCELKNKSITTILKNKNNLKNIQRVAEHLLVSDMAVFLDECTHKKGHTVPVIVWIFQVEKSVFKEFFMPLSDVIGYE